jgi:hypothetical protein
MSVLGREQDSYQRALEAYQRQINRYNRSVDKYKATLVKDNNGNLLVIDGGGNVSAVNSGGALIGAALPRGFDVTNYGATDIPGGQGYRQLRQGEPTEQRTETRTGLRRYDGDYGPYYVDSDWNTVPLGNDWKITLTTPAQDYGDSYSPALYTATRNASTYMSAPPEWKKEFNRKAPSATPAQAAKVGAPSLAEVEGGLVGEVMRGKGVRYGVPVYRPKVDA